MMASEHRLSIGAWLTCALGVWLIICSATSLTVLVGSSFNDSTNVISVPLVILLGAAGSITIVNAMRPHRWASAILWSLGLAVWLTTVYQFGNRGLLGAIIVGAALASLPFMAAVVPVLTSDHPLSWTSVNLPVTARLMPTLSGIGLILIFGTPVVNAWMRGVAPYDLQGIAPSNFLSRVSEFGGILMFALGVAGVLGGATARAARLATLAAAAITVSMLAVAAALDPVPGPVLALRYVLFVGVPIVVTALLALTGWASTSVAPTSKHAS